MVAAPTLVSGVTAPDPLAHLPTPLEALPRLSDALSPGGRGPRLLVKRDDCTGLALGGNKARKLVHLCAEAAATGCDVLVTGGGVQSNHVRMTAAAANRIGMDCHVVLAVSAREQDGPPPGGNLLLDQILGVEIDVLPGGEYYDIEAGITALADRLAAGGRRPYAIPVGGASITGVTAYADAADELRAQMGAEPPDWVVVADGSGGTHAGLVAGLGDETKVLGVDVGTRPDLDDVIPVLAAEAAQRTGRRAPTTPVHLDRERFGTGYGAPTEAGHEAILLAARHEGLILDPVYTGKAMAGLVHAVRTGRIGPDETAVFWHTGGAPALFASRYADDFSSPV